MLRACEHSLFFMIMEAQQVLEDYEHERVWDTPHLFENRTRFTFIDWDNAFLLLFLISQRN